jgi:hypothetical protein
MHRLHFTPRAGAQIFFSLRTHATLGPADVIDTICAVLKFAMAAHLFFNVIRSFGCISRACHFLQGKGHRGTAQARMAQAVTFKGSADRGDDVRTLLRRAGFAVDDVELGKFGLSLNR